MFVDLNRPLHVAHGGVLTFVGDPEVGAKRLEFWFFDESLHDKGPGHRSCADDVVVRVEQKRFARDCGRVATPALRHAPSFWERFERVE